MEAVELPLVMMNFISTLRLIDEPALPLSAVVSKSLLIMDEYVWAR